MNITSRFYYFSWCNIFFFKNYLLLNNYDLIFKQFLKITHGSQAFILNGLNLAITCTGVGKENTEPRSQLMQRGSLAEVVLCLKGAWLCSSSPANPFPPPRAEWGPAHLLSLQCGLCRPNVPVIFAVIFFYPVSLNWATQTQHDKGSGKAKVLLGKADNNSSLRAFHSSQCAAEMSVKKTAQLPPEVIQIFFTTASSSPNNIHLPLCNVVTNRSMESCY